MLSLWQCGSSFKRQCETDNEAYRNLLRGLNNALKYWFTNLNLTAGGRYPYSYNEVARSKNLSRQAKFKKNPPPSCFFCGSSSNWNKLSGRGGEGTNTRKARPVSGKTQKTLRCSPCWHRGCNPSGGKLKFHTNFVVEFSLISNWKLIWQSVRKWWSAIPGNTGNCPLLSGAKNFEAGAGGPWSWGHFRLQFFFLLVIYCQYCLSHQCVPLLVCLTSRHGTSHNS